jgi:hypothetical protein
MRWPKRTHWQQTEGTVSAIYLDAVGEDHGEKVVFTYKVDGHWYSGTFASNGYVHGQRIPVLYDPSDPHRNNLVAKNRLLLILCWSLVAALALVAVLAR